FHGPRRRSSEPWSAAVRRTPGTKTKWGPIFNEAYDPTAWAKAPTSASFHGAKRSATRVDRAIEPGGPGDAKRPAPKGPASFTFGMEQWLHHPAHAAHVGHATACRSLFGLVGDEAFRREQQTGDRGRVLQRSTRDLRGVDDARFHQVLEVARGGVEAD